MKTTWSEAYISRRYSSQERHLWVQRKFRELTSRSGVPWTHDHVHGREQFLPFLDYPNRPEATEATDIYDVKRYLQQFRRTGAWEYRTILEVSEATGLGLLAVMSVVRYLVSRGEGFVEVNRMGKVVYVRLRR